MFTEEHLASEIKRKIIVATEMEIEMLYLKCSFIKIFFGNV